LPAPEDRTIWFRGKTVRGFEMTILGFPVGDQVMEGWSEIGRGPSDISMLTETVASDR
jgi:hypothetical protein